MALQALAGLLAASAGLAVAAVVAAFVEPASSPVYAVGSAAIDRTPEWLKSFAIERFGEHDKQVLLSGIFVTVATYAAVVGVLSFRNRWLGLAGTFVLISPQEPLTAFHRKGHVFEHDLRPERLCEVVDLEHHASGPLWFRQLDAHRSV